MHADVLDRRPWQERAGIALAVLLSLLGHALVGGSISSVEPRPRKEPVWAEMMVVTPPPPPEPVVPEPEPEPEPERPKPPPPKEAIPFEDTRDVPPPDAPPPDRKPVRQLVQGLSNTSFVEGTRTGLTVNAGNTTAARASKERLPVEDVGPYEQVAYEQVTTSPRIARRPLLQVPDSLKEANISGSVGVELTIDGEGRVLSVRVVAPLHPDADAACVRDVKSLSRWAPGTRDGSPVTVTGVPFKCTYLERE